VTRRIMTAVLAVAGLVPAVLAAAPAQAGAVPAFVQRMSPVASGPVPDVAPDVCVGAMLRTGSKGTTQVDRSIDGQTGVAQVPTTVPGAAFGRPAAGDVYVIDPATGEFFQGGWYVGGFAANNSSTGLPSTATPRAFFGEWTSAGHERLSSPIAVSPGQHAFSVRLAPDGRAFGFVDGVLRWTSSQTHWNPYVPGVTGESNNTCTSMNSRWFAQSSSVAGTHSLQLHRFGGAYAYWVEHLTVDNSGGRFVDGRFGGQGATDCANPTGSCGLVT
jgi:hypothetical protein